MTNFSGVPASTNLIIFLCHNYKTIDGFRKVRSFFFFLVFIRICGWHVIKPME